MDPAEAVYMVVSDIPAGTVATYGQVADLVDTMSISAREVGAIMNVCPPEVPWQRVVGAGGHLPIGKRSPELKMRQRQLLESEGVEFLASDRIDMDRFQLRSTEDVKTGLFEQP